MSRTKDEILESMYDFMVKGNGGLSARFMFKEDFIGFQGHFPNRKILPGVCQIQCIKTMLEAWKNATVSVQEIVRAKYLLPVSPGEELVCNGAITEDSIHGYTIKTSITRGEEKISEFTLKVSIGES